MQLNSHANCPSMRSCHCGFHFNSDGKFQIDEDCIHLSMFQTLNFKVPYVGEPRCVESQYFSVGQLSQYVVDALASAILQTAVQWYHRGTSAGSWPAVLPRSTHNVGVSSTGRNQLIPHNLNHHDDDDHPCCENNLYLEDYYR